MFTQAQRRHRRRRRQRHQRQPRSMSTTHCDLVVVIVGDHRLTKTVCMWRSILEESYNHSEIMLQTNHEEDIFVTIETPALVTELSTTIFGFQFRENCRCDEMYWYQPYPGSLNPIHRPPSKDWDAEKAGASLFQTWDQYYAWLNELKPMWSFLGCSDFVTEEKVSHFLADLCKLQCKYPCILPGCQSENLITRGSLFLAQRCGFDEEEGLAIVRDAKSMLVSHVNYFYDLLNTPANEPWWRLNDRDERRCRRSARPPRNSRSSDQV